MDKELQYLGMVTQNPERPCVAILGGAKVSDKIEVIENLAKVVDKVLIGGAMAYTFLKSQGHADRQVAGGRRQAGSCEEACWRSSATKLVLPVDHVVASEFKEGAENENVTEIPDGQDGARYRRENHRRVRADHSRREDDHLERADGRVRKAAVR